jgi:multidrug resistance efflux pump
MGAAEALKADVIAQEQSTIRSLLVEMFAEVSKGDYVGMLDDSSLNAEIDVLNAGRKVVEAEIGAERARLVQEESDRLRSMDIDGRRLALDVETARMELLDRKVAEQVHQIELQRLAVNFQRIERLAEEGSVSAAEADDIRLQMEAVAKDIEENESVIATAEANLQASKDRLSALAIEQGPATEDSLESYLHPLSTEVAELNAQTRQLELSRERWVLKAPIDGVVVSVYRRVG